MSEPIVERRHARGDAIIRIIGVVVNESFRFRRVSTRKISFSPVVDKKHFVLTLTNSIE
jgi:hypothetical protein